MKHAIYSALKIAQNLIGKTKPKYHPPVVHISKMGGILPLIPFFGRLSVPGNPSSGAACIAEVVNDARSAKHQF